MNEASGNRGNAGYASFRGALLSGQLQPGVTLTQAELCETLGMSLSPLRDTLTLLEADGLVSIRRRAGVTVVEPDVAFIRRNFQFRTLIEGEAIVRFAEAVPADWLADMRTRHQAALDRVSPRSDMIALGHLLGEVDQDLHRSIVAALRNPMIDDTHAQLQENLKLARVLSHDLMSPSKVAETLKEHLVVIEKLAEGDTHGSAEALDAHFRAAIHRVFAG
ncbi:GntR family transcriptional regulator [Bauldia sp.]|uniref:GntR family transcriptional regulator n=1 Tax=Bauldia sp. TaxID=2575872 RepID=UPI003BA97B9F